MLNNCGAALRRAVVATIAPQKFNHSPTIGIMDFTQLINHVSKLNAPDLHMQVGQKPIVRLENGDIAVVEEFEPLSAESVQLVIDQITNERQKSHFQENLEFDFSHFIEGIGRFRVNIFYDNQGPAIAFRLISENIPSLADLGMSSTVEGLAALSHGLILVTGATGMGKSTTLAAIIDHINTNRRGHIITIEDPIEYTHKNKSSLVTQREVNVHTHSFANAIKSSLRQDPDVVMIGEMRDLETMAAAMTLAETGHLVFSTLHTQDAAQTIDRILDVFPAYQQQQIKTQLGNTLKGIISQVLLPRSDGKGRVAAREIMITNDAIRNCIVSGQPHQIYSMIQIGASQGMISMDQALEQLVVNGFISKESAIAKSSDPETLSAQLEQI